MLRLSALLAAAVVLFCVLLARDLFVLAEPERVLSEGGSVEVTTAAILWMIGVGLLLARCWALGIGAVLLALRELDFDKRFTSDGVLQLRLYSGDAALWEKGAGLMVIALVLWAAWRGLRDHATGALAGLSRGQAWAFCLAGGMGLGALAKGLDGIGRKLAPFGVEVAAQTSRLSGGIEEVLELIGAMLLLVAYGLRQRQAGIIVP